MKNNPRTYGERRDNEGHANLPVRIRATRVGDNLPGYFDEKPRKKQPRPDRYKNKR